MFIILMSYKKSLDEIEQYLSAHRHFLDQGYQNDYFIASGPKKPRTGGVIISQLTDRARLEKIISQDPFYIHDVINYEIIEFTPTKYHEDFSFFVK